MRIAIFTETFLPKMDGIVRVVCLTVDHLVANGHEAIIVAPRLGEEHELVTEYNGQPVITLRGFPLPWYPELRFTYPSRRVYHTLKTLQPDVAHFFHPVTIGLPGLVIAKQLGISTLVSFHLDFARLSTYLKFGFIPLGFLEDGAHWLTTKVFNWADYSLAPSRHVQNEMLERGVNNIGLWRRGVDAETFNPRYYSNAIREEMSDGNPDDTILLYVGRLSPEKKLEHIRAVLERVPHTRLVLVGDGPYRAELERIFAGTNTKFMGYVKGEKLSQVYASADIFTFPSSLETFGLVVVEAMAAGLPVVASRVGGVPDVVEEGVTGYTFDIGDIEGLVAGVQRVAESRECIQQMGHNARTYAEAQTWGSMMDELLVHYERLSHLRNS